MNHKEEAKRLVDRFLEETPVKDFINLTSKELSDELLRDLKVSKQCALICCDEKIKMAKDILWIMSDGRFFRIKENLEILKQEIKKL